jgi:hydrogenase expression/formation protein HypC
MCLAIPAKVLKIEDQVAKVDFGGGSIRNCNISLVDVNVGDYVIVHAGFAIQVLDETAAKETLKLFEALAKEAV